MTRDQNLDWFASPNWARQPEVLFGAGLASPVPAFGFVAALGLAGFAADGSGAAALSAPFAAFAWRTTTTTDLADLVSPLTSLGSAVAASFLPAPCAFLGRFTVWLSASAATAAISAAPVRVGPV